MSRAICFLVEVSVITSPSHGRYYANKWQATHRDSGYTIKKPKTGTNMVEITRFHPPNNVDRHFLSPTPNVFHTSLPKRVTPLTLLLPGAFPCGTSHVPLLNPRTRITPRKRKSATPVTWQSTMTV
ncbi:hypothetical protein PIB30_038567 [Stylosanthes scabra]|uniref:Secreted protein n=1 Tax=Stylosanthes scabra TaxID=79078 RepID=A0ABU6ZAX7_9FABA|nr:hypothetical protein [Stylosanthes scabra]